MELPKKPPLSYAALAAIIGMGAVCAAASFATLGLCCWSCGWCERVPVRQLPEHEKDEVNLKGVPPPENFHPPEQLGRGFPGKHEQ